MDEKIERKKPLVKKQASITPITDRIPLSEVVFTAPTEIEGFLAPPRRLADGAPWEIDAEKKVRLSFDPVLRLVVVGRDLVPVERAQKMRRFHG